MPAEPPQSSDTELAREERFLAELVEQGRARMSLGFSIGGTLMVAFWALDLMIAPAQRWLFLAIRIGGVVLAGMGGLGAWRTRDVAVFRALQVTFLLPLMAIVPTLAFFTGGFTSLYVYFVPLPLASLSLVVPFTVRDGAIVLLGALAYCLIGDSFLLWQSGGDWTQVGPALSYLITSGVFIQLAVVLNDRTRRAEFRLRSELIEANARLQASLQQVQEQENRLATIGRMTSAIVHDSLNPLTSVLAGSRYALDHSRDHGLVIAEDLRLVVRSGDRLRQMLENVLEFAKGGARTLNLEQVPVSRLLAQGLEAMGPELARRRVELATSLDGCEQVQVQADAELFRRVMENLLRNSIESIEKRAGRSQPGTLGQVGITARLEDGEVAIRVVDDGEGIPEEIRAHLFEPFSSGKSRGTGLGLTTARELARAQGGELAAEPARPEGGAVFRFTLKATPPF